jgi:4-diphosphocytidyl-2-C-methyl-D-erythritol kinase
MSLKIAAYGKINLTLHITGKREDGYHTLDTIMQSISLADIITLAPNQSREIQVTCSLAELSGEENLVYKAAKMFFSEADISDGISIHIEKHIPVAAGLGGGSADAAAVLAGLNILYREPFTLEQLKSMALSLGADVPFCLVGGTCLATGIGEELIPLENQLKGEIVLVKPCEKGSTGEMYRKYDEIKGLSIADNCAIMDGLKDGNIQIVSENLYNDFLSVCDGTAVFDALQSLKNHGAVGASLSGSGPTVFGLFADKAEANKGLQTLNETYSQCYAAEFTSCGWQVL